MIFPDSKRWILSTLSLILTLWMFPLVLPAQKTFEIRGKITSTDKVPLPAVVYIPALRTTTVANTDGDFSIKVLPGTYTVQFRSMSFRPEVREVNVTTQNTEINIELSPEALVLNEVEVSSGNRKDPAIDIMRKAIAKAPFHLREVKKSQSTVYLKGTMVLDKVPLLLAKIFEKGAKVKVKSGNVYVEESVVDVTFHAPRLFKKNIRSLHSNFPFSDKSPVNPLMAIEMSFYQPTLLGNIISPLSPVAFQHYKFRFEGSVREGETLLNKIRVIPKRKSQELFEGIIYLVEDQWCLHSVDLHAAPFWGNLHFKESSACYAEHIWLPASFTLDVSAQMMGARIRYKYVSSVRYSEIIPNQALRSAIAEATLKTEQKQVAKILAQDKISKAQMRKITKATAEQEWAMRTDTLTAEMFREMTRTITDSVALMRDTAYWNEFRPVPLTPVEIKSYEEGPVSVLQKSGRDSLSSTARTDSLKAQNGAETKKKSPFRHLFGTTVPLLDKKFTLRSAGIFQPDNLSFNTVDGIRYGLNLRADIRIDSARKISINPWGGYAVDRHQWLWTLKTTIPYLARKLTTGTLTLGGGYTDTDFTPGYGIPSLMNTAYSLLMKENYLKLYQTRYLEAYHSIRWNKTRITWNAKIRYDRINELENHSNLAFLRKNHEYAPNTPNNPEYTSLNGDTYKSLVFSTSLTYDIPYTRNIIHPYRSAPSLKLSYAAGLSGILGSRTDFHKLSLNISQLWRLRQQKRLEYSLSGEYWLSAKDVWFHSFSSIKTSELLFTSESLVNSFQLLPYYTLHNKKWQAEAHIHFNTPLLILKRLPLISNRVWDENLYLNYLHTPELHHYMETGYSLGQIYGVLEVGVFTSFERFHYQSTGLRISLGL